MSGLYPSLEDLKVDQMVSAQLQNFQTQQKYEPADIAPTTVSTLYPSLDEYMGTMGITQTMIQENMQVIQTGQGMQVSEMLIAKELTQRAPVTANNVGLMRAEVKQGVRQIVVCKDQDGKIGLRVKSINKGVFVAFVHTNSPGSLAGLRFGDQILQINEQNVAGWETDQTMNFLKKADPEKIKFAIRDRPFERTITLQKDSTGHVGFVFKENRITAIVKDSSAARNGVLIEHHIVEVNGQNVVGLKEKEIKEIFETSGQTVTITVLPSFIYEHIVKSMGSSLIKKFMDHSVPDA